MSTKVAHEPWSEEALFGKARLYTSVMESHAPDDWQFGFWSALVLELVTRAALAHVSPLFLADGRNWHNLQFALGQAPTAQKFVPKSISAEEAIDRLAELSTDITPATKSFCSQHFRRRNAELHSGELAFSNLGNSIWLPLFYQALAELLRFMGKSLDDIVNDSSGPMMMIESLRDQAAESVKKDIAAHSQVWSNKTPEEKEVAIAQATAWATRHAGHRVTCPACNSPALLQGNRSGVVKTEFDDNSGDVVERQTIVPTSFECIACGLRISGFARLAACGLGNTFTAKMVYTPAEFFDLHTDEELDAVRAEMASMHEPDFNEY